jgi:glycosyltransferase involved in cell wall biosynthesis
MQPFPNIVTKFAFVLSSLKFGGGERVALNLARAFKAKGLEVEFLLMSYEGEFLAEAEQHFNVVDLQCDRTWELPAKLAKYLCRQKPDVLISSFWKLNLCACLARLIFPKIRLLLWEHSPPSKSANSPTWLYAITASFVYRLATKVVAVSTGVRDDIASITLGLGSRLVIIFNPISPPAVSELQAHTSEKENLLVWVGRLDTPKNPLLMVEAFGLLPQDQNYSLEIIGDGPMRTELEHRVKQLGLQKRISLRGFQENPYKWMMKSKLLVLSSVREGLPTVLVEALYCGLRVVSTDCGRGVHDILLDNCYGTIVPAGDPMALAKAISHEMSSPSSTVNQTEGAQRFMPDTIANQFLATLNASLSEP